MAIEHQLRVGPLPPWLDADRFLGHASSRVPVGPAGEADNRVLHGLSTPEAADVAARLRGVVLAGHALQCVAVPTLPRAAVRAARTRDARRRRATTPGFSRSGTRLDDQGRISLTPEALAMDMAAEAGGRAVVDATCGAGGNAIAFARAGCRVIAVELDRDRLACARHNARQYGVQGRIEFVHGDARHVLPKLRGEVLMLDPPWGDETNREGLGLAALPLLEALLPLAERFPEVWAKLPPAFDVSHLPGWSPRGLFGAADGDRQRVKFLWLLRVRGAENAALDVPNGMG